jgi:uncharacterized lipoprotein YajG
VALRGKDAPCRSGQVQRRRVEMERNARKALMMRCLLALIFCFLAAACATPSDTISINYVPQAGAQLSSASRGEVYVTAWDARGLDPRAVAARLDKDGNEIGTIRADRDVADIFRSAFETELKARGFQIGTGTREGAHVDIKVERFFNRAHSGIFSGKATADVALTATVSSTPSAPSYTRHIEIEGKKPGAKLAGGVNHKLALENGLADAIADLTDDHAFMGALDEAARAQPSP